MSMAVPQPQYSFNPTTIEQPSSPYSVASSASESRVQPMSGTEPSPARLTNVSASFYPPTSNAFYPFPSMDDEVMECDDGLSPIPKLSPAASDPVHSKTYDNRYPSNASTNSTLSNGLMQPKEQAFGHHG